MMASTAMDLDKATLEELQTLKGIGPAKAKAIADLQTALRPITIEALVMATNIPAQQFVEWMEAGRITRIPLENPTEPVQHVQSTTDQGLIGPGVGDAAGGINQGAADQNLAQHLASTQEGFPTDQVLFGRGVEGAAASTNQGSADQNPAQHLASTQEGFPITEGVRRKTHGHTGQTFQTRTRHLDI